MILRRCELPALVAVLIFSTLSPAYAAPSTGLGSNLTVLSCMYSTTLPTLNPGQTSPLQCDINGRFIPAPLTEIFSSPFQTQGAGGVGQDTAFPSSVSTSGTSLGSLPSGANRLQLHIPPGASVSGYVAPAVASNATAAALVSETYNNASGNTNNLDVSVELNGQLFWVTNYTSGTSSTYISGKPVFRYI